MSAPAVSALSSRCRLSNAGVPALTVAGDGCNPTLRQGPLCLFPRRSTAPRGADWPDAAACNPSLRDRHSVKAAAVELRTRRRSPRNRPRSHRFFPDSSEKKIRRRSQIQGPHALRPHGQGPAVGRTLHTPSSSVVTDDTTKAATGECTHAQRVRLFGARAGFH